MGEGAVEALGRCDNGVDAGAGRAVVRFEAGHAYDFFCSSGIINKNRCVVIGDDECVAHHGQRTNAGW